MFITELGNTVVRETNIYTICTRVEKMVSGSVTLLTYVAYEIVNVLRKYRTWRKEGRETQKAVRAMDCNQNRGSVETPGVGHCRLLDGEN